MKIRHRITLWITAAGLLAGLLFSVIITLEMIEQPYELLDAELDAQAHTLLTGLVPENNGLVPQNDAGMLNALGRLYWFKVLSKEQKVLYSSAMTNSVNLPLKGENNRYNISAAIPPGTTVLEQDDSDNVTFRVRVFTIPVAGQEYLVQIARPMEKLQEEITDLIIYIIIGLALYTVVLLSAGYFAAGKILRPITDINALAREISEQTLNTRIPLGRNRDELYTLSSSLNQMFDRLQFSFQRQKEFIANASHELKTPIAMQRIFFNEAMQRDDLPDDFTDKLSKQTQSLYRMDRLVKNLLDLSALELQDSFDPKPVTLSLLLHSVLEEYQEIFEGAAIQLSLDIQKDVNMQGDEEKLRRAFINLLDNAIKYNSGKHREIRLHLSTENNLARLELYNTGQGIPPKDLKQVFNQFYRVEQSRAAAFGGSGLGLTIVKRIIDLHQGSIELQSEEGKWVQVNLGLPLQQNSDHYLDTGKL